MACVLVVTVLLTSSLVAVVGLAPSASAAVTTGVTRDLVIAASPNIRDDSTAIPFWGFGATANAGESLTRVEVYFDITPWSTIQTGDFKALANNAVNSGVAIYRDSGAIDDQLDATDAAVNSNNINWLFNWPYNYVQISFNAGVELVPAAIAGNYQWFVVVRTDPDIPNGATFRTWVNAGGIQFSNGANQPAFNIAGTRVTSRNSDYNDVSTGAIGGGVAQAALGLTIVDGGPYEYIDRVTVRFQNDGGFDQTDMAAFGLLPATSGAALYRDDGTTDDAWDASDSAVVPTGVAVAWPSVALSYNNEPIPDSRTGSYEYFVVVRTSATIANGDAFTVYGDENSIRVRGTPNTDVNYFTPEANHGDSAAFVADLVAPTITSYYWSESSPYLHIDAAGELWFSDKMTSGQTATFNCQAQDNPAGSGMWYGEFSYEPSLASGGVTDNTLPYTCGYSIDSTDTDLSTPATVTVYDRAANSATASLAYRQDVTQPAVMIVAPGKFETLSGIITVLAVAADGQSGLDTTSAQVSWDYGASWHGMSWTGVTFKYAWDTGLLADGTYRLLVTVRDNVYNIGSDYVTVGLDNTGPASFILSQRNGQYVNSARPLEVVAAALDASLIASMEARLDGGAWTAMTFDAADLVWRASVGSPGAGDHYIGVRATDSEGNVGPEAVVLVIGDANDPTVSIVAPAAGSDDVGGWLTFRMRAADQERLAGVKVVVSDGTLTYTLDAALNPATGYYELPLDTRGLHDGTWGMVAVAFDEAGRMTTTAMRSLVVDNTEPALAIDTPASGTYVYGTYRVTASASDAGAGFDAGGVAMSVDGGPWSLLTRQGVRWEAELDTTALADGPHTILVAAIDDAGNVVVRSVTVYVDNTPPSVSVVAPFGNQRLAGVFTFATSARDDVGVRNVSARIAGPSWTIDVPLGFNAASGYYEWAIDTSAWPDGEYGIKPYATELSGRAYTMADELAFFVDNNAPEVDLMHPLDGEVITSPVYQLEVGALDGAFNLASGQVSFRVDASDPRPLRGGSGQSWWFDWNTTEVADGPHTITFRAVDASGKVTEQAIRVVVDNHDPAVELVAPSAAEHVGGRYTFAAHATDQVGVRGVDVTLVLNGQDRPGTQAAYNPSTGLWELTIDTTTLPDGPTSITLTATDASGRASTTGLVAFSIDNHAPALAIDRPAPDAVVIGGQFDIEVNASDEGFTLVTGDVEYDIDGTGWASVPWAMETPTMFTLTRGTALLSDSWHLLSVRATDAAGHVTERSVRFMVDNHDPALEIVSPNEDQYTTGTLLFQVAASDPNGISAVTLDWRGGRPVAATLDTADNYYEFTLDTTTLPDGNYTVLASATDGAGRESQVALDFRVDNHIPGLTVAGPLTGEVLSGTVTVRGAVKDTFVDTLQFSVDGVGWVDMQGGEGTFDSSLFADGPHAITVRAIDGSGKAVMATSQVTLDNEPPLVSVAGFPDPDGHVAGEVPFKLFATDKVAVVAVTATVGPDAYPVYLNPATGFYEWSMPSKRYADGPRTVLFAATDPAGHNTTLTWGVYVDNTAPDVSTYLPAPGAIVKGKVTFSAAPNDATGTASMRLRIGDRAWVDMAKQEDGTYVYTWETSLADNVDSLRYTLRATDSLGNARDVSATIKVENPDYSWVAFLIMAAFIVIGVLLMFLHFRKQGREGAAEDAGAGEEGSATRELEELDELVNAPPPPKKDEEVEVEAER